MARGRRPSVVSLDSKIARLQRIVERGRKAEKQLDEALNTRKNLRSTVEERIAKERAKLATLEAELANQSSTGTVSVVTPADVATVEVPTQAS